MKWLYVAVAALLLLLGVQTAHERRLRAKERMVADALAAARQARQRNVAVVLERKLERIRNELKENRSRPVSDRVAELVAEYRRRTGR